jgi:hemerythrin-like domain-containing protein
MTEVREEIWSLLAKYLCGEATTSECVIVELLLRENAELRTFYHQMEMAYAMTEDSQQKDSTKAFARLDQRIKKSESSE